ncbi:hypothetical protein [Halomicrobium salinisoli]|uniref:hypothetical protein n=1 Tax=Halomicrobium salinisoli TaxID=2878391 RepID=UPI001CF02AA6|nr:hypothetical protein [Halomicrobium salinisoli]
MTENTATVEASTVFEMLADDHRRDLLFALLDHDPRQAGQDSTGVSLDGVEREEIVVEMHHVHLPKLEGAGFIRWNHAQHRVERGPTFDEIRPLLQVLRENAGEIPGDQSSGVSITSTSES